MVSPDLQAKIAAAVCPSPPGQPCQGMGVVGIEPTRREYWRVWVYTPGEPRLLLFLVLLRGNAEQWTFDVQHALDIVATRSLRERRPTLLRREVCQFVCDYGQWTGIRSSWIREVPVPRHPLFDSTDRLWSIQAAFQERGRDECSGLLSLIAWLHDEALYLACGWSSLLEAAIFP